MVVGDVGYCDGEDYWNDMEVGEVIDCEVYGEVDCDL